MINFRLRWGVGAGAFHNFQPAPEAAVTSRVEKGVRGQDGPAQDDETTFLIKIRAVDYKHCDDLALARFYYLDLQFCFRNEVSFQPSLPTCTILAKLVKCNNELSSCSLSAPYVSHDVNLIKSYAKLAGIGILAFDFQLSSNPWP